MVVLGEGGIINSPPHIKKSEKGRKVEVFGILGVFLFCFVFYEQVHF